MALNTYSQVFALSGDNVEGRIYVTEDSTSTANNTSSITVYVQVHRTNSGYTTYGSGTVSGTVNGTSYSQSITSSTKVSGTSWVTFYSKTYTITHDSDGSKTITVTASIDWQRTGSSSLSCTLTTIPRASSMSVSGTTLGSTVTFTITRASSSFTHTISWYFCGQTGTITTKTSNTSVTWTPSASTFGAYIPSATSGTVTYTLTTYSGSTAIGSKTYTSKLNLPSYSLSPTLTLSEASGQSYYSKYGAYIKGKSKLAFAASCSAVYGGTISSYKLVLNGATYTSSSGTTGVLSSSGTLTGTLTVTDSRGKTGSKTASVTVLAYSAPAISSVSVHRCDSDGTENISGEYAMVTFSASVTSLSSKNSAAYTVKYKKASASSYTSVTQTSLAGKYSVSGATYIFAASSDASYDIQVTATDDFSTTTKSASVSTGAAILHFNSKGNGMGIGKLSEGEEQLDIGWVTNSNRYFVSNWTSESAFKHVHPTTGYEVRMGVGTGGYNRGLYDGTLDQWMIYADKDGNTRILNVPIVGGHSTAIGSLLTTTDIVNSSLSASTTTQVATLTVPAGSWILTGQFVLAAISSSASSGFGCISPSTSSDNHCIQSWYAPYGNQTRCNCTFVTSLTSNTTYYLLAYSTLERSVSNVNLRALRIA